MEKKIRIKGEVYLLLSGFFFGLQPFFAKIIYAHGGDAYSLLVLRFLISGTVFAAIYMLMGQSIWLTKDEFISIFILSVPDVYTVIFIIQLYIIRFSVHIAIFLSCSCYFT